MFFSPKCYFNLQVVPEILKIKMKHFGTDLADYHQQMYLINLSR